MPAFNLPLGAAHIVITATTGLIWTLLVWHIRLFIRLKIHGPFSWDDIHCTIATVLGICNSGLTILQTSFGLGRHTENVSSLTAYRQHFLAWLAAMLYYLAICFSLLSVCFLIIRITKRTEQARIAYAVAAVTGVWAVVALFILAFQCELPHPWKTRPLSRCIDIVSRRTAET